MATIVDLPERVSGLNPQARKLFEGIFEVSLSEGKLVIPRSFEDKAWNYFSAQDEKAQPTEGKDEVLERLRTQRIVRTFNRWTTEGALFNELRASRPGMQPQDVARERRRTNDLIEQAKQGCDFCEALKYTSEDTFGRVRGRYCITGANVAKFDSLHGLVFFDEHHPLQFSREQLADYIETAFKWFEVAHKQDGRFAHPFLVWNCLGKSGASQVHGHAQMLLGKGAYYGKAELLRRAAEQYAARMGRDYFDDLFGAHDAIGLARSCGQVRTLVNITPVKEKETLVISRKPPAESSDAMDAIYAALRCLVDKLGVTCFNLTISMPAMGAADLPYVVRVVDRGSLFKATSDIAGMELYGSSVIGSDPYRVIEALSEC